MFSENIEPTKTRQAQSRLRPPRPVSPPSFGGNSVAGPFPFAGKKRWRGTPGRGWRRVGRGDPRAWGPWLGAGAARPGQRISISPDRLGPQWTALGRKSSHTCLEPGHPDGARWCWRFPPLHLFDLCFLYVLIAASPSRSMLYFTSIDACRSDGCLAMMNRYFPRFTLSPVDVSPGFFVAGFRPWSPPCVP